MTRLSILAATFAAASPALAHTGAGATDALAAGVAHPLGGADHLLAMLGVGLWAGLRAGAARWAWPMAFVAAMLVGGALGAAGVGMPLVEPGILASLVILGGLIAAGTRAPVPAGAALVALFGLLHGHAHGTEAPATGGGALYALGFVLATSALHATGLGLALLAQRYSAPAMVRLAGVATATAGLVLALA